MNYSYKDIYVALQKTRMTSVVRSRRSLKSQITIATLALFLVSMWSLAFYASKSLQQDMVQLMGEQQFSTVSLLAANVNDEIKDRLHALDRVASGLPQAVLKGPAAVQTALALNLILQDQFNAGIFVVGMDGTVIADFPRSNGRIGSNFKEREMVMAALREGKTTVGQPVRGQVLKKPVFGMAAPIRNAQGQVVGALAGAINLEQPNFLDVITANHYGTTGGYLVISPRTRRIITATDKSRIMTALPAPAPFVQRSSSRFIQGYEGYDVVVNQRGVETLGSAKSIPVAGWFLAASLPTEEAFAPIRMMQRRMLLASMCLSLLVGGLIWWLLRRQLAPLLAITDQLEHMSDQPRPMLHSDDKSQAEINNLVVGFNRMLATLDLQREKLKQSEAFSHTIMDSVATEIAVLDRDGFIVAVNEPWRRFSLENSIGPVQQPAPHTQVGENHLAICQTCISSCWGDTSTNASKGIQLVLDGSIPGFTLEYPCHLPSQNRWYSLIVTPLGIAGQGVVVARSNITQCKRAESALQLTRTSVEAASDSLLWLTPEGRIFDVNQATCSLLGYTRAELLQLGVADIDVHAHDHATRWARHFEEVRRSGTIKFESEHIAKDGRRIPVEISASYVRFGLEDIYCAFVRDITRRKKDKALLVAAKAEAEKANRAKSRFLAAASHDLRQPLSALSLYIGVLKSRVMPENSDLVSRIQDCANSLTELLGHLLDVSKLEAGVVTPVLSDFAVDDMLAALMTIHEAEAVHKGLRLRVRRCSAVVHTDQKQFKRILGNLLANAIRYTDQGGVLVSCRRHAGKHWVEVWDTGRGIPADKTEHIFEEYTQLGNESTSQGSGLGLAIVAKTAKLLNLQIRVCSRPGRGSVFAIELPLGRAVGPEAFQVTLPSARALRIGLVDDDAQLLRALVLALESSGHEVIWATGSHKLIERLGQHVPDIVVSDYRLGESETGYDVIGAARAVFGPHLPAIIITGDTAPELIRSMAEQEMAIHYKPLQMDTLLALIRQSIERRTT